MRRPADDATAAADPKSAISTMMGAWYAVPQEAEALEGDEVEVKEEVGEGEEVKEEVLVGGEEEVEKEGELAPGSACSLRPQRTGKVAALGYLPGLHVCVCVGGGDWDGGRTGLHAWPACVCGGVRGRPGRWPHWATCLACMYVCVVLCVVLCCV